MIKSTHISNNDMKFYNENTIETNLTSNSNDDLINFIISTLYENNYK